MRISPIAFGVLLMLGLTAPVVAQDRPDGRWSGAIQIQGIELAMNVHFRAADETASIDIPPQGAFGLALRNVKMSDDAVSFELPAGPGLAVFNGTTVSSDRIAGSFSQGGAVGTFYLTPNPETDTGAGDAHADEDDISIEVDGGTLHGGVAIPSGTSPVDLVILHAGSGPTNRDGNSQSGGAKNNSLLLLSDALVNHGLAVLRYDKRGIGASAGAAIPEADLRFEHFVRDLEAWITHMRADGRFRRVLLAGHSEGALVATLAAARTPVDGLVLIAGTGRPAGTVLREQLQRNLPPELYLQSDQIIASLEAGELVDSTPPDLAALFRESVQPYLISWFALDPVASLRVLKTPTLIIQGTTDIQVTTGDAENLAAARPDAELRIIDGMNHVLKDVSGDRAAQMPSYGDPSLPINAELHEAIAVFAERLGTN